MPLSVNTFLGTWFDVSSQARQASKAVIQSLLWQSRRAAQPAHKPKTRRGQQQQQQQQQLVASKGTALTLAQLQGKLVSVPAKVMYCRPGKS